MIDFVITNLWLSLIVGGSFVLFVLWLKSKRKKRYDLSKITIKDIDKMDGFEFEDYLYVFFCAVGYETYQTKKSRDFGADLLFVTTMEQRTVVQAKRYLDKVGLSAVQEVYSAQAFYDADTALIVTSSNELSEPCLKLATATSVKIIDREDLIEMIHLFKKGDVEKVQALIETPDEPVEYLAANSLIENEHKRGLIQSGDYFYKA
ncbi:restriction endonuclease [Halalkalibacter urbisdiaboli]|uniref:restriction endonuclease n=1 Tax=Halalkalibacter urbisdiaboli TaxID=1960589 RepID=UPI000B433C32|nr:restriction endonuclease [Halalkalibacter urbisdiaboli]